MPFLSDTCAGCRIGRALFFGQVNLAYKAVININALAAYFVLVILTFINNDFLHHFTQKSVCQFFDRKVLADNAHKLFSVYRGFLCLVQLALQSGGSVFQFPLLGFVVCGHFHETLITDFPVYIVLIQTLDVAGKFCNAALHLFKLLGCRRQLPLAAHFILLDKQLHEPGFVLLCIGGHFPQIVQHTRRQKVGANEVRRTVGGALLIAAADVAILLSLVGLIPLLVHHMTAVGAEQQAGEQAHIIVAVGAFALLA